MLKSIASYVTPGTNLKVKLSCRVAGSSLRLFTCCLTAQFVKAGGKGEERQDRVWGNGHRDWQERGGGDDDVEGGGGVALSPAARLGGRLLRSHWQIGA